MKKIAILQSNYIPWKGYFDLINMVDEFVIYDDVQYTKDDWRNRNRIKTKHGLKWLTIPVKVKGKFGQRIMDAVTSNSIWRKKHWKSLCQWYSKAAYFKVYKEIFEQLYLGKTHRFLSKINYDFIYAICRILGIKTKLLWSSDFVLPQEKTERLVEICRNLGATEYLSGPAAKGYLNEEMFKQEGIKVQWMDYSGYGEYPQLWPPFEHGVSILDLIFNTGKNAITHMKSFRT